MHTLSGPTLDFIKIQGCGNDFVAIDNRAGAVAHADMENWARVLCRKAFGVGADGIFFLENPPSGSSGADVVWHFYNADGSRAEMCGNASRCAARLAYEMGMAPKEFNLGTDAGVVRVQVLEPGDRARSQLTPVRNVRTDVELTLQDQPCTVHHADTGVPHAVMFVDDAATVDILPLGRALRVHPEWELAGANANFAQQTGPDSFILRTYERGVEDETFACGTGAAAVVYLAHKLGMCGPRANLVTSGGDTLTIELEGETPFLTGAAEITFVGKLNLKGLGLA